MPVAAVAKSTLESTHKTAAVRSPQTPKPAVAPARAAVMRMQQTFGNRAVAGMLQRQAKPGAPGDVFDREADHVPCLHEKTRGKPVVESAPPSPSSGPKLDIGAVHDPLEQEADRVAVEVMRMPTANVSVAVAAPELSRKGAASQEEDKLRKEPAGAPAAVSEAPAIVHEVLRSPGQPLDERTRAFMEPRFGRSFDDVRVHVDTQAAASARAVNAVAYTVGRHIVFGAGHGPWTRGGQRVLAHELTHVAQQNNARRLGAGTPSRTLTINASAPVLRRQPAPPAGPEDPLMLPKEGIDMPWEPRGGKRSSELGYLRDTRYFWSEYLKKWGNQLSPANKQLIAKPKPASPIVDDTWLQYHRQHAAYKGQKLEHHHVGQGSWAVPLPEKLHDAYTVFHPQRQVMGEPGKPTKPVKPDPSRATTEREIERQVRQGRLPSTVDPKGALKPGEPPPSSVVAGVPPEQRRPVSVRERADIARVDPKTGKVIGPLQAGAAAPAPLKTGVDEPLLAKPQAVSQVPVPVPKPKPAMTEPVKVAPTPIAKSRPPKKEPGKPPGKQRKSGADDPLHGAAGGSSKVTGPDASRKLVGLLRDTQKTITRLTRDHPEYKDLVDAIKAINTFNDFKSFLDNPGKFVGQTAKTVLIQRLFDHFSDSLEKNRSEFVSKFPSVDSLHEDPVNSGVSLEEYQRKYKVALARLRLPDAQKALRYAFVTLGVPDIDIKASLREADKLLARLPGLREYVKAYYEARDRYAFALVWLKGHLRDLNDKFASLPSDFADEKSRLGHDLAKGQSILEGLANQILDSPFILFEAGEAAWYDFTLLAEGFGSLSKELYDFAYLAGSRKREYTQEINRLETEHHQFDRTLFQLIH